MVRPQILADRSSTAQPSQLAAPSASARAMPLLLVIACLAAGASSSEAQYFGRNKVQYDTFEFKTLKTEHFDIYYYEEEQALANHVARMAERWYARLTRA